MSHNGVIQPCLASTVKGTCLLKLTIGLISSTVSRRQDYARFEAIRAWDPNLSAISLLSPLTIVIETIFDNKALTFL